MNVADLFPKYPVVNTLDERVICRKCQQPIKAGAWVLWTNSDGLIAAEHHLSCVERRAKP